MLPWLTSNFEHNNINYYNELVKENRDSDLKLVNVMVNDSGLDYPKLDIKIRNTGDTVAFLKDSIITVKKNFSFKFIL